MITQLQQQLKDLNQAYYEGQLSFGDYRHRRGLMLDSLFEDTTIREDFTPKTVPMQSILEKTQEFVQPRSPAPEPEVQITTPPQQPQPVMASAQAQQAPTQPANPESTHQDPITEVRAVKPKSAAPQPPASAPASPFEEPSSKSTYIIIGAVVLCAVIGAAIFMTGGSSESATSPSVTNTTNTSAKTGTLQTAIEKHLQANAWTPTQLREIESLWRETPDNEKNTARKSPWHHKLTDTLAALSAEQKALIDLGNKDAAAFDLQINRLIEILKND